MLKKLSTLTDQQLLTQYRQSKNKAYIGELYQRYEHLLLGVALNYVRDVDTAKDIVVTSFDKLFVSPQLTDIEQPRYWLYRVVRNTCITHIRRQHTEPLPIAEPFNTKNLQTFEDANVEIDLEKRLIYIEDLTLLADVLETLPPLQRQCLVLFYYETMTYKQIAHLLCISSNTVKTNIQNGKIALKKLLSN